MLHPLHRRLVLITAASLVLLLVWLLVSLDSQTTSSIISSYLPRLGQIDPAGLAEYALVPEASTFCPPRYGLPYLDGLRDQATEYCTAESPATVTCFHSRTASDNHVDSFCLARAARLDPSRRRFRVGCRLAETPKTTTTGLSIPAYGSLRSYWYDTGPGVILRKYVELVGDGDGDTTDSDDRDPRFTILIKREGALNPWHCLMEMLSMTLSLDVLRLSSLYTLEDLNRTQVVILDNKQDGPYYELWSLMARRPIRRLEDIVAIGDTDSENLIVPLPGASNPIWQGDWEIHPCRDSPLLRVFAGRIRAFYGLDAPAAADPNKQITVTYIDRNESRRLVGSDAYLQDIRQAFPDVLVQAVDFAAIPFREQVRIASTTDILLGVHGAGLTHGLFMDAGSVMVEILPPDFNHKGFRNFAGLLGHAYYSVHASSSQAPDGDNVVSRDDWHQKDVILSKDRFMELIDVAVKSLYNKGSHNLDVN
ncbi:hypothetical protein ASPZODRAFT_1258465 [Penicilliopsis zonata CBS 506.65]|uniref:EGF domain-specific O-linked N-acetylglucosamine transferase n=1 Tax=Penicilliopsis zonata CBS 506.65 TaxID=1073090 RepID=A0A1L9S6I4_9EURO|nr:hypothetical protein ASPZODRAFT_1258465 [Penicilliopsis zonata CBS 506.65]OJJ42794.1 hypothetical protein ASPZODRAFT_1258465 [Penicilliopsis zonata CBS 506.65]